MTTRIPWHRSSVDCDIMAGVMVWYHGWSWLAQGASPAAFAEPLLPRFQRPNLLPRKAESAATRPESRHVTHQGAERRHTSACHPPKKKQMTSNARPAKVRHLNSTEINQSAENPWPNLAVEGLVSCFAARQGFPQGLQRSALGHGQIMFATLITKIHIITMNHGENGLSPTFAGCIVLQTCCTYSLVANHQTNHVDVTFQTQKTCDPTIFNGSSGFLTDENS